jgi:hypothetical protein
VAKGNQKALSRTVVFGIITRAKHDNRLTARRPDCDSRMIYPISYNESRLGAEPPVIYDVMQLNFFTLRSVIGVFNNRKKGQNE